MDLNTFKKNNLAPYLVDSNYKLQKALVYILRIIHDLLRNENLSDRCNIELETTVQLLVELINNEKLLLKPTTKRLKNKINQALIENQDGDGVIVRVVKNPEYKIEKCSLLNFYIYDY